MGSLTIDVYTLSFFTYMEISNVWIGPVDTLDISRSISVVKLMHQYPGIYTQCRKDNMHMQSNL